MVNSLLRSLTGSLTILLFWIYFFLLILVFVLQWLSFHWGIQIMLLSQFPFTFCQTQNEMPISFCSLVIVLVIVLLIGMVFVIIGEMFHGRISLKSVPLVNFVSGLRLELINISHHNIRSSLSPWFSAACATAIFHRNHFFFVFFQQDKFSESKFKFRQDSKSCKRVFEAAKRAYANKAK